MINLDKSKSISLDHSNQDAVGRGDTVRHPQSNGICERLHRTMQDEFYAITFRKKLYHDLISLQIDLNEWFRYYNMERPHSGRYCYGKTTMQTFEESLNLAKQKLLNQLGPEAYFF